VIGRIARALYKKPITKSRATQSKSVTKAKPKAPTETMDRQNVVTVNQTLTPRQVLLSRPLGNEEVQVVEIEWYDAVSVGGLDWVSEDDIQTQASLSFAIGYLVSENKQSMTIVALVNENHYAHGITIPKGMITAIRRLG
jgi:hypothetical protein